MPKYLFTSDQRISKLSERIQWIAKFIVDGHSVSEITDKSENNNTTTLRFYYNLYSGTEVCANAAINPIIAIRNFVKKFQFPNTRTPESLNDSIGEKMLFAPYRSVIKMLYLMASKSTNGTSTISLSEILYFLFCNPFVFTNPLVNYEPIIEDLLDKRNCAVILDEKISKIIEWKQYSRQVREMMNVLVYASSCFKLRNEILSLSIKSVEYLNDKDFIDELLSYNKIWYPSNYTDFNLSNLEYISYMDTQNIPYNVIEFDTPSNSNRQLPTIDPKTIKAQYRPYITAIRTKPFLLLAGISGTGKSRIVRELARTCWYKDDEEYKAHKPRNFEMVQVKPNWHDSTELIGYVSRISGTAEFVAGDFLKFIVKAWEEPDVPYFLCLDEMNLAPVEQYFAEFLSVIESRKLNDNGEIETDPILKKEPQEWYHTLVCSLTEKSELQQKFLNSGISIPKNLIVIGTVNMDETTFSFSRKVLDRAMTIEMNEVDLYGGLEEEHENIGKIEFNTVVGNYVEGVDVYKTNKAVCDIVIEYLQSINKKLDGTPFKIAYRTRNDFLLYVVNNLPYKKDENGGELNDNYVIARALDEITSMKILSRIEGDEDKTSTVIRELKNAVESGLKAVCDNFDITKSISLMKLDEMEKRLESGFTSFWS
jgi:hypothetical protein